MCIRYYDLMLGREVKSIYSSLLTNENSPVQLKCQVLKNIQTYLQEEEIRMIKQDSECKSAGTCIKITFLIHGTVVTILILRVEVIEERRFERNG